jgi:hypothetical protein
MVQRRPEGMGGKAITDYRSLEGAGITSAIEQIGGWGKALIKKDIEDTRVRGQAKQMVLLGDKLKVSRAKGDGNNTRFELINTHIKQFLKGGGEPEVAIWLRKNMQHKDLEQVLGRDGVVRNVDEKGVIWGKNSERVPQPQSATPEKGMLEDALEFEQGKNAEVRVLARKSTAAFAAFGSGLENVDEYVVDGGELTDRVNEAMKFILGKKGQILYKDLTSIKFVSTKEKQNMSMLKARIEGVFSEFLPMAARAIDDPKNTVNPGSVKQFSRAIKGDIVDAYNKTPGARLAFGENFIDELNLYFDGRDGSIDAFLSDQFTGTDVKNTFEKYKMAEATLKLDELMEQHKYWAKVPPALKELQAYSEISKVFANFGTAATGTGNVRLIQESLTRALAPLTGFLVKAGLKELEDRGSGKPTKPRGVRIFNIIDTLLSDEVYVNQGADWEPLVEAVESYISRVDIKDKDLLKRIKARLKSYKVAASRSEVEMKSWMSKLGDQASSGVDTMKNFIDKLWGD